MWKLRPGGSKLNEVNARGTCGIKTIGYDREFMLMCASDLHEGRFFTDTENS
jgi:hypothetical protein